MEKQFTTLQELLHFSVEKYSNNNSLAFVNNKPYTYSDFGFKVEEYSELLKKNNIKQGEKVAILSSNSPEWGISYFAILNIGAVVVPLMTDFSEHEISNILIHSETKAIFVQNRLLLKNEKAISKELVIIDIDNGKLLSHQVNYLSENTQNYNVLPSDLAAIIYTSGTTGKSKGVMLTHHNLVSQIKMVSKLQPIFSSDIYLSVLPLSHTYECSLGLLTCIMSGCSTYYLEKPPTATVLLPAINLVKPTLMLTVPLIIEKIFKSKIYPELTKNAMFKMFYKIPFMRKIMHKKAAKSLFNTFGGNLRFFGIGGAKLDYNVERFLIEGKLFPYAIGYGLTETSPLIAGVNPQMVHIQSTGPALSGVTLKINNPDRKTGEGEIWAKGDNIMMGYFKEPELTKQVLTEDNWFKTGDVGFFDKKNRLYIKSRLKNVIIGSNGENIYPEDIESVINSHRFVSESIVVEKKGRLVALVNFNMEDIESNYAQIKANFTQKVGEFKNEFDEKLETIKSDLINYVNSRVSNASKISYVIAIKTEFEKTPTQKIKRFKYANSYY